ncbi:MAG: hypothetical protein AAFX56_01030 [Pseudomonadota bacterium]
MVEDERLWRRWRTFFQSRANAPLPVLESANELHATARLGASLARFQRSEARAGWHAGGGLTAGDYGAEQSRATAALGAEKARHGNILAIAVRALGAEIRPQRFGSRRSGIGRWPLFGLAAEAAGTAYYMSIAAKLPVSRVKSWLEQIVSEKRSHLEFRAELFAASRGPSAAMVNAAWPCVAAAAALHVLLMHGRTLRDMGIERAAYRDRHRALADMAKKLVQVSATPHPGVVEVS